MYVEVRRYLLYLSKILYNPNTANQPIQVKQHNGRHELERNDCRPEDGRGGSRERGEGFGDVRRKKIGKYVPTKAEDKLELRRRRSVPNRKVGNEPDVAPGATGALTSLPPLGRRPEEGIPPAVGVDVGGRSPRAQRAAREN